MTKQTSTLKRPLIATFFALAFLAGPLTLSAKPTESEAIAKIKAKYAKDAVKERLKAQQKIALEKFKAKQKLDLLNAEISTLTTK